MIVVVEGPDGAGKTTMIEALGAAAKAEGVRPLPIHHGHVTDPYRAYSRTIDMGRDSDVLVLADRLHYGELVYGHTRRSEPAFGLIDLLHLNDRIREAIGQVMVLVPPLQVLRENHARRGEEPPVALEHERLMFLHLGLWTSYDAPTSVSLIRRWGRLDELEDHASRVVKLLVRKNKLLIRKNELKQKENKKAWNSTSQA